MKQGLKIVLFILPQLFALFVKSNNAFSATDDTYHHASFNKFSDHHFTNLVTADSFQEYELEFEDDEFSDFFSFDSYLKFQIKKKKTISDDLWFAYGYHVKLYILYSSLKLYC